MQQSFKSNASESASGSSLWLLIAMTVLSFVLLGTPFFGWLLTPVQIFVTCLHEMGHAIACLLTGGSVHGLTIVADGHGAAGLTFTSGGNAWIIDSAGYLGAATFGCLFLWLGKVPSRAKTTLTALGALIGIASLVLMPRTIFMQGGTMQGLESMAIGLGMSAVLLFAGLKLKPQYAHLILLFLAVQTALNALTDIKFLIELSLGIYHTAAFSDATNMQGVTGIPAAVWSVVWGVTALVMLTFTLRQTYFSGNAEASGSH